MKLNLCKLRWRKRRSPNYWKAMFRAFKDKELQKATTNFSDMLGSTGCFGSVHRGKLPDSTLIAVKRLETDVRGMIFHQDRDEFEIGVWTMRGMDHINLLQITGFFYKYYRALVFDYMPCRSLDLHLFRQAFKEDSQVLDWNRRYQIALGTARGMAYLHCSMVARHYQIQTGFGFIHGNIKPENILLDSEFCPKLTDYFYWFFFGFNECLNVLSTSTRTRSYIAPEVLSEERALTTKSDVYSYGMVLFEIISGIRNSENGETPKAYPKRVASVIREGSDDILSVLDSRLGRNADEEEVLRVCKVACWCVHIDPQHRPSMELVIGVLEGVIDDDIINLPPINQLIS